MIKREQVKGRKMCECYNPKPSECWDGDFVILFETNSVLGYEGTSIFHSKCGLPLHPSIPYHWKEKEYKKVKG